MSVFHSACGLGAGAWLHAPMEDIKPMTDDEWRIAALLRLDKPLQQTPTRCTRSTPARTCNCTTNTYLDHALTCQFGPYRVRRHNALRDALAHIIRKITDHEALTEQTLPTLQPPPDTAHPDDIRETTDNRADVTLLTTTQPIHLDVMVTSAVNPSTLAGRRAIVVPGINASIGENYKRRKYHPHTVTPIVFEAHGRFGADIAPFLTKLTSALPLHEQSTAQHYAIQYLSTTLQRHNARTIAAHLTQHTAPMAATAA